MKPQYPTDQIARKRAQTRAQNSDAHNAKQVIGKLTGDVRVIARDKIKALLHSDHCYLTEAEFTYWFAKLTGRAEHCVQWKVRAEIDSVERNMDGRGKDKRARATQSTCERIWGWFNTATEYKNLLNDTDAVLAMMERYEPVVMWAVMLGQIAARDNEQ